MRQQLAVVAGDNFLRDPNMKTFNLKPESGPETEFTGELLAEFQHRVELQDERVREFRGTVYSVEGGGFVAEVRFSSDAESEGVVHEVELIDSFADVDKFFYVVDLHELLCDHISGRDKQVACAKRAGQLEKAYHNVLFPFLDKVKILVVERGLCDRLKAESGKAGIWKLFSKT